MLLRSRLAYMKRRARHKTSWEATVHSAMQTAIADELKARYEPPRELTRELSGVVTKLDDPKGGLFLGTGLKTKTLTSITGFGSAPKRQWLRDQ
jgi:hypothetical protein